MNDEWGETFRVLKEKEIRLYGDAERWTRRRTIARRDRQAN